MNTGLVVLFVLVDIVATAAVVLFLLRRRGLSMAMGDSPFTRVTEASR